MANSSPKIDRLLVARTSTEDRLEGFSVQARPTSGRKLKIETWKKTYDSFIEDALDNLELSSKPKMHDIARELEGIIGTINSKIDLFVSSNSHLSKKQYTANWATFYHQLRQSPDVIRGTDLLLYKFLNSEHALDVFRNATSEAILINSLKHFFRHPQNVDTLSWFNQEKIPPILRDYTAEFFQDQLKHAGFPKSLNWAELPEKIFDRISDNRGGWVSHSNQSSTINFYSPKYKFHSIFRGICGGECIGGENKDDLDRFRWSVIFIDKSKLYLIEKNNRYKGFVSITPWKTKKGEIYAAFELGSDAFLNEIGQLRGEPTPLYDIFLQHMEYLLPDNWHLVHGKEDSIRNYGTLPVVRDHKTYINGEEVSSDLVVRNGSTLFNYIEGRFVKEMLSSAERQYQQLYPNAFNQEDLESLYNAVEPFERKMNNLLGDLTRDFSSGTGYASQFDNLSNSETLNLVEREIRDLKAQIKSFSRFGFNPTLEALNLFQSKYEAQFVEYYKNLYGKANSSTVANNIDHMYRSDFLEVLEKQFTRVKSKFLNDARLFMFKHEPIDPDISMTLFYDSLLNSGNNNKYSLSEKLELVLREKRNGKKFVHEASGENTVVKLLKYSNLKARACRMMFR